MKPHELVQNLLNLQNGYMNVHRAIVTKERLEHKLLENQEFNVKEEKVRETLLEHIGHLPLVASFVHPYIQHTKEVNLGRVLIMLSIHDIGETVTGDIITYGKTDKDTEEENKIARGLLPKELLPYFDEFELRESLDAKYAKSIDALAPFLHEIDMPKLTRKRFSTYGFNSEKIDAKKRPFFEWDSVLLQIFEVCLDVYQKIEKKEPTGLAPTVDLP